MQEESLQASNTPSDQTQAHSHQWQSLELFSPNTTSHLPCMSANANCDNKRVKHTDAFSEPTSSEPLSTKTLLHLSAAKDKHSLNDPWTHLILWFAFIQSQVVELELLHNLHSTG